MWWEEDFLGRVPQPVRGTRDAYSYCVVNLKRVLGPRRAAGLAVHEVTDAIKALSTTGRTSSGIMSRSYVSRHLNILSQAFDYAVAQERLGRNPAKQVKLPRTARAESTRKSFDLDQHARFIAAAQKHRWGALFIIGATLGLRPGEVSALCWDCVDLERGTIDIVRAVRLTDDGRSVGRRLKTNGSVRKLKLPTVALEALRSHASSAGLLGSQSPVPVLVFSTSTGSIINPRNLAKEMRKVTASAGLGADWTPYEMRHSAASVLNDQGVALELIADLLGNKDTRMLAKHYRHRLTEIIDVAVEPMNALVSNRLPLVEV